MNKKIKFVLFFSAIICGLLSCLKDNTFLNIAGTGNVIEFSLGSDGSVSNGGELGATDPSVTEIDTVIAIDISSPQVLNYPVTVAVKFDTSLLALYDTVSARKARANGGVPVVLQPLPDSCFSVTSDTITILSGHRIGLLHIKLYPSKIDVTQSYGLPFSILSATGNNQSFTLSANFGHMLYAFIGNPIGGFYEEYWSRWNATDTSSGSAGALYYNYDVGSVLFTPNSPVEIQVVSEGTGETDILDFTNTGGTLSNFTASFPSGEATSLGLTSIGPAQVISADPIHGVYQIYFPYVNGGGSPRAIVNTYIKK
jgi:uncharacterized protein YkvS